MNRISFKLWTCALLVWNKLLRTWCRHATDGSWADTILNHENLRRALAELDSLLEDKEDTTSNIYIIIYELLQILLRAGWIMLRWKLRMRRWVSLKGFLKRTILTLTSTYRNEAWRTLSDYKRRPPAFYRIFYSLKRQDFFIPCWILFASNPEADKILVIF